MYLLMAIQADRDLSSSATPASRHKVMVGEQVCILDQPPAQRAGNTLLAILRFAVEIFLFIRHVRIFHLTIRGRIDTFQGASGKGGCWKKEGEYTNHY